MPIPTHRGQFRYVESDHDGGSTYQCLWCLNMIGAKDDPSYWNFCPKCGKSWFTKLQCRDHHTPRWFYDRWGNSAKYGTRVITTVAECSASDLKYYSNAPDQWEWYFEVRSTTNDSCLLGHPEEWGRWGYAYSIEYSPNHNYRYAKSMLKQYRLGHEPSVYSHWKWEYRATLRKFT